MRVIDNDFNNILLDEKSYKNLLTYNISYKTFMDEKPLRIWLDKIDRFINGSDYRCIISLISKNEAINLMQTVDMTEKSGTL